MSVDQVDDVKSRLGIKAARLVLAVYVLLQLCLYRPVGGGNRKGRSRTRRIVDSKSEAERSIELAVCMENKRITDGTDATYTQYTSQLNVREIKQSCND
jgi:hypothetical protein